MADVLADAKPYMQPCGPHDYGLNEHGCNCPPGDSRPIVARLAEEVANLREILEGAVEEWAVVYGDHSHYRVSGSQQALQMAAVARSRGTGEAYAAHRLLPEWRRMEEDRG